MREKANGEQVNEIIYLFRKLKSKYGDELPELNVIMRTNLYDMTSEKANKWIQRLLDIQRAMIFGEKDE